MSTNPTPTVDFRPNPYPAEEKALNAAIAKAQGEMPAIPKDKMVDTGTYKYAYADLASILALVRPVLAKHGLALVQRLEATGGKEAVRTELRHADGGVLAASFPIGERPQSPQQLGSLLTYLRRYAIVSMLGIAAEEDDDGRQAAAVNPHGTSATSSAEESPFQPPDLSSDPAPEDLTAAQRRKIFATRTKLIDAGIFSEEQFKAQLGMSFGVDSVSGLTKDQASALIERLLKAEEQLV